MTTTETVSRKAIDTRAAALTRGHAAVTCFTHGATGLQTAARMAADLVMGCRTGETNAETPAGADDYRAVTFTLSGGGPGSDVTIILDRYDGDAREGFFTYYDGGNAVTVYLDRQDAQDVYNALTAA